MHSRTIDRIVTIVATAALLCGWLTSLWAQSDPKDYPMNVMFER